MIEDLLNRFDSVWFVDFEFHQNGIEGNPPVPICLAARELKSSREYRLWHTEFGNPPYDLGKNSLFVSYYASAELGCHEALSWPMPFNILDLWIEFRMLTNYETYAGGRGLLDAIRFLKGEVSSNGHKDLMRDRILKGSPYTEAEKQEILKYCAGDVEILEQLFHEMVPLIKNFDQARYRGEYMRVCAHMEYEGLPIDTATYENLSENWEDLQFALIKEVDKFGIFEGKTFKTENFELFLRNQSIRWPRLPSGKPRLDKDTFKDMGRTNHVILEYHQLRVALSQLKLRNLSIGEDGRNRVILSPYGSKTGRHTPSNSKFILGPSTWFRSLLKPPRGYVLIHADFEQQEFGIAAILSRDENMKAAYISGDPYLSFGKLAGKIPFDGTKETHPIERDMFKQIILAVQYGMGPRSFAYRINDTERQASELLAYHREIFREYWKWSDVQFSRAVLKGEQQTKFGWTRQLKHTSLNERSIRNFFIQANGAEILRLAGLLLLDVDVNLIAPLHDAVWILSPLDGLKSVVEKTTEALREASGIVLDGFKLRVEVEMVKYPDRFVDKRAGKMWAIVQQFLQTVEVSKVKEVEEVR